MMDQRVPVQDDPDARRSQNDTRPGQLTLDPQPTQSGDQCPIGRPEGGSDHLATEHGNLVSEHDDFNGQLVAIASNESTNWRTLAKAR
jgi:hypothetical protein